MEFPVILSSSNHEYYNDSGGGVRSTGLLEKEPGMSIVYLTVLSVTSLLGSVGNMLVIASSILLITRQARASHNHGYAFICNLACSDLIVTALINPFAMLGVVYGDDLYAGRFALCRVLGSVCVISCVVSLLSIGCIATNRYLYICHHVRFSSLVTRRSTLILIVCTWIAGVLLDLPSHLTWSRHTFDQKSHKCIWDRAYNYYYSVFFVSCGMLLPLACITLMHALIFVKVSVIKAKIARQVHHSLHRTILKAFQQTRMMLVVFVAFVLCWSPYIFVLLIDKHDTFKIEVHLFVSLIAHTHASVNFLIYGVCNTRIRNVYKMIILQHLLRTRNVNLAPASSIGGINNFRLSSHKNSCDKHHNNHSPSRPSFPPTPASSRSPEIYERSPSPFLHPNNNCTPETKLLHTGRKLLRPDDDGFSDAEDRVLHAKDTEWAAKDRFLDAEDTNCTSEDKWLPADDTKCAAENGLLNVDDANIAADDNTLIDSDNAAWTTADDTMLHSDTIPMKHIPSSDHATHRTRDTSLFRL